MQSVKIQKSGRIVLPKKLRACLGLTTGQSFRVEQVGNNIVLEQVTELEAQMITDLKQRHKNIN